MARIRQIGIRDLDAVAAIYAHYVNQTVVTFDESPPGPEVWLRRLNELAVRSLPFMVAEDAGEVAGFAYCTPWRGFKPAYRHTCEDTVYVAPDARGQGHGRELLRAVLHLAERSGVRQVVAVVVDADNPAPIHLHERFGYRTAGRLVGVGLKHGRWLDTVLLQRTLFDGSSPAVSRPTRSSGPASSPSPPMGGRPD